MRPMSSVPQASATAVDGAAMRRALGRFCTGVTVVSTAIGDTAHGMTASAFTSVSLDPPLVLVSIAQGARMHALLPDSRRYGVSVLAAEQEGVARHFAGQPLAEAGELFDWHDGLPLLRGAIVHISCRLHAEHPAGDHTLFVGHVERIESRAGEPLLYLGGAFGRMATPGFEHLWGW